MEGNEVLTNVLNMTLYAFGKWGTIKGLKVDQDYSQLNSLFQEILKDMKIKPGFRDDYFRFYKDEIQMTYEEVAEAAIEEGRRKAREIREEEEAQTEGSLGLWHKICWSAEQCQFASSELTAYEKHASRLGNNFYRTGTRRGKKSWWRRRRAKYTWQGVMPVITAILFIRRALGGF